MDAISLNFPIITTMAIALSAAFLGGLCAIKLRLSPICGYLLAGIIIGTYTPGYVADIHITEELSEIGIVLLMFGVGLHFSLRDLLKVQRIAIPGAIAQMGAAIAMGAALAYTWGWSLASGIMFGLALSVASTVVLLRGLKENNLLDTINGRIAIGWLVVEDIAMVLALVLVPVLAGLDGTGSTLGATQQLVIAMLKFAAFVTVMLLVGGRVLPWLLQVVENTRSNELFTLAIFTTAVGVAFAAAQLFGVSFALGAFFAGMMIRESDLNQKAAKRSLPFQDIFAVLFFVSVGMLFNPAILIEQPLNVLAVVAIIMVGKTLAALLIVEAFGYPRKTGLLVSAGLSQIGEFSFILAALGVAYGLLPVDGRHLIVAGALISIALNSFMFRAVPLLYRKARRNTYLKQLLIQK